MGKVEYTDKSKQWLDKLDIQVDKAVGKASAHGAQIIRDQIPGGGFSVVEGTGGDTGKRGRYIPSNPGNAPGWRTGRLRESIAAVKRKNKVWVVGDTRTPKTVKDKFSKKTIAGPVKYARHLEFGTGKMAARPFIRPGFEEAKKPMFKTFFNTLKRGMKQ